MSKFSGTSGGSGKLANRLERAFYNSANKNITMANLAWSARTPKVRQAMADRANREYDHFLRIDNILRRRGRAHKGKVHLVRAFQGKVEDTPRKPLRYPNLHWGQRI